MAVFDELIARAKTQRQNSNAAALDRVAAERTKKVADAQAVLDARENSAIFASLSPAKRAAMTKATKADLAAAAGEDPRITKFNDDNEKATRSRIYQNYNPLQQKVYKNRDTERRTAAFYKANPDLDPRLADETVKVANKSESAETVLQEIFKLISSPDTPKADRKFAVTRYNQIKSQLTPAMRTRYNLDSIEKEGLLTNPTFKERGLSKIGAAIGPAIGLPGVETGIKAIDAPRGVIASLANQGVIGAEEVINKVTGLTPGADRRSMSWKDALVDSGLLGNGSIGAGTVYTEAMKDVAFGNASEGRAARARPSEIFGGPSVIPGLNIVDKFLGGSTDNQGNFKYDNAAGLGVAQGVGAVGDVGLDPTTYLSLGTANAAKVGLKVLRKSGEGEAANLIIKSGVKSFDAAGKAKILKIIEEVLDPASKKVVAKGREGAAQDIFGAMERGGQRGIRFGGRTVIPFSFGGQDAAQAAGKTITNEVTTKVRGRDIRAGDTIDNIIGSPEFPATVVSYDPDMGRLVLAPNVDAFVSVVRKGAAIDVMPGEIRVGDVIDRGKSEVVAVNADGSITIKTTRGLSYVEHPFEDVPLTEPVGTQGTLMQVDQVPAPPDVNQQGNLLTSLNENPLADAPRVAQEAFDTNKADDIGEGLLPGRQDTQPTYIVTKTGKMRSLRPWEHPTERSVRPKYTLPIGAHIYAPIKTPRQAVIDEQKAALAAGRTPDRVAAHLANRGPDVGEIVGDLENGNILLQAAQGEIRNMGIEVGSRVPGLYGVLVRVTPDGLWEITPDPSMFRGGAKDLPTVAEASKAGRLAPGTAAPGGTPIPDALQARAAAARLASQPAPGYIPTGAVRPAAASDSLPATTPTQAADAGQGSLFGGADLDAPQALFDQGSVPLEGLPNTNPYPPRPTVGKDVGRLDPSKLPDINTADLDEQQILIGLGFVPTHRLQPNQRIRGLDGVVVDNPGGGLITVKLDDGVARTVIDGDKIVRLLPEDLKPGHVLLDSGLEVVSSKNGQVALKGASSLKASRTETIEKLGGIPSKPKFRDTLPGARAARDKFVPRGSIEAAGREGGAPLSAAEAANKEMSGSDAKLANAVQDNEKRYGSIVDRLRKALGVAEGQKLFNEAFDVAATDTGGVERAITKVRKMMEALNDPEKLKNLESLSPGAAATARSKDGKRAKELKGAIEALETGRNIRNEIIEVERKIKKGNVPARSGDQGELSFDVGGISTRNAQDSNQLPLMLTEQGRKALALQPELAESLGQGTERKLAELQRGIDFSELDGVATLRIETVDGVGRSSFVDVPLTGSRADTNRALGDALNEQTKKALGITDDEPFKMFEENALTVFSARNRTAQAQSIAQDTAASAEKSGAGIRLYPPGNRADDAAKAAYEAARKAVPAHYVEVPGMTRDGQMFMAEPSVARYMSRVDAIVRNDQELASIKKVVDQATALWTRQVLSPLTKGIGMQMRNLQTNIINATIGGMTLDGQREAIRLQTGALRKVGKIMGTEGDTFESALAKLGLAPDSRDATLLRYLREDDILNTGMYRQLDWDPAGTEKFGGRAAKGKELLNPLSKDNIVFKPGRAINQAVEDNGRMALYISVFDKTGSRDAAREAVRDYLFDYADLTAFESHLMKNINAFYTFTRKNTALQIRVAMNRPAIPLTILKAKAALADDDDSLVKPGESQERGYFQAGKLMQKVIGGKGVVGIDDPVTSAIRTIDPVIQTAYYSLDKLSGGQLLRNLPQSERPTGQSLARGYIGLTVGGPAEVLTTLFEIGSGRTLRGRTLEESNTFTELRNALLPVWKQGADVINLGRDENNSGTTLATGLLRLLSGITAYRRDTDEEQIKINYAMRAELSETIDLMVKSGVKMPTMTDLETVGLIPKASDIAKARTVPLTQAMKNEEARKKLGLSATTPTVKGR